MFPPELRDEDRLPAGEQKVDFSQKHPLFNDLCPQDSYTEEGVYWVSSSYLAGRRRRQRLRESLLYATSSHRTFQPASNEPANPSRMQPADNPGRPAV